MRLPRPRFRLRALMIAVAIAALGIAQGVQIAKRWRRGNHEWRCDRPVHWVEPPLPPEFPGPTKQPPILHDPVQPE